MAHLPVPGQDDGQWGAILNEYLRVAHHEDGTLREANSGPLRNVYNPRDFGAAGNGTDDDTDALQQAIDAASGGGTLFIPAGIYATRKLLLPSNLTICGEGQGSVLRLQEGTSDALFTNRDWINGNSHIALRNLRLEGNSANNPDPSPHPPAHSSADNDKSHGINFHFVEDSLLDGLYITDFFMDGIYLGTSSPDRGAHSTGSNRNRVHNCRIVGNGRNGISITRGTDNSITGNILSGNNKGALSDDPEPFHAGAITIEPNGDWYDVSRNIVQGNHLLNNHSNGIQILKNWTSQGILLSSNVITGTARHGIAAALVSGLVIQGNHVSFSDAVGMALGLGTGIKDSAVSGNIVCHNGSTGILVNGAQGERIVVTANVTVANGVSNPYGNGISWVDAQQVTLVGNICLENSAGAQIVANGADPIYVANRTERLNIPSASRVIKGNDIFADYWRMHGTDTDLYVENQRTGQTYRVQLEPIA